MKLLIMNYSMNEESLVFSHQREVARRLSKKFEETFVVTADENLGAEIQGVCLISSCWKSDNRVKSVLRFYRKVFPLILKYRRKLVVFSHMTEVQSFLIAPWCRLLKIPHFLWYAHASKSFFLYAAYPLVNGVVTSTPGSCPLKGSKVYPIGQAIDEQIFTGHFSEIKSPPLNWYHVGRIDPSKKIDLIIDVFTKLRKFGWEMKLNIYGAPSSDSSQDYLTALLDKYRIEIASNWLCFKGSIRRHQLTSVANEHDGFVHAFQGSLDKAVLEAVLTKRIVASINPEFIRAFSYKNSFSGSLEERLFGQIIHYLDMSPAVIRYSIESNYEIAKKNHTMERWLFELCKVLKSAR